MCPPSCQRTAWIGISRGGTGVRRALWSPLRGWSWAVERVGGEAFLRVGNHGPFLSFEVLSGSPCHLRAGHTVVLPASVLILELPVSPVASLKRDSLSTSMLGERKGNECRENQDPGSQISSLRWRFLRCYAGIWLRPPGQEGERCPMARTTPGLGVSFESPFPREPQGEHLLARTRLLGARGIGVTCPGEGEVRRDRGRSRCRGEGPALIPGRDPGRGVVTLN
jgi:hypothetical protein